MHNLARASAALLASACAGLAATSVAAAGIEDETLLVSVPKGFVIGKTGENGPMTAAEYVPEGETVADWSRMVTVQVFHNLHALAPDRFASNMKSGWLSACSGSEVTKVKDGKENGYDFSVWLFSCPLNIRTGKPESMFMKIIGGRDALYSVQYAYRASLTKEMIAPAVSYLADVRVCDTRLPDRPCPAALMGAK